MKRAYDIGSIDTGSNSHMQWEINGCIHERKSRAYAIEIPTKGQNLADG